MTRNRDIPRLDLSQVTCQDTRLDLSQVTSQDTRLDLSQRAIIWLSMASKSNDLAQHGLKEQ
jgi:hypothetical protein